MAAHARTTLTHGCYRCELNVDEMRHHAAEMRAEVVGINAAIEVLKDHRRDLTDSITETTRAVDRWSMFRPAPTTAADESGAGA